MEYELDNPEKILLLAMNRIFESNKKGLYFSKNQVKNDIEIELMSYFRRKRSQECEFLEEEEYDKN